MPEPPSFARYAVYYAPREGSALADFGAAWLGEAAAGEPIVAAFGDEERRAITAAPRRYRFHGTLNAPFHLAEGTGFGDLERAVRDSSATASPARTGPLALTAIGPFLALCPTGDTAGLDDLAARIVREVDPLRAPLSPAERARRAPERLSARQRAQLDRWGYPYVFDDFRFHLTLTGPLAPAPREDVAARLAPLVACFCRDPFEIFEICVFADPGAGRTFELVSRHRLGGS